MKTDVDYLLYFDSSTTLPNQLLLREQFENSLETTINGQQPELVPVVLLELELFDMANKPLSGRHRDSLFREMGKHLMKKVWGIVNVTRLSSKRFAIILSPPEPGHTTVAMLQEIERSLASSFAVDYLQPVYFRANLGVAYYPCDGADLATLIGNAEKAMLEVKAAGGSDFQIFTPPVRPLTGPVATQDWNLLLTELNSKRQTTVAPPAPNLYYQAQFDYRTNQVTGVQAFAGPRLAEYDGQPDSDKLFVKARTGYEPALKKSELRAACFQFKRWLDSESFLTGITVKLAASELIRPGTGHQIAKIIAETGLEPRHLAIEVGEDILFKAVATVSRNLADLKALGIGLTLGNIENGYSTLMYLKRFHFDRLKIDLKVFHKYIKENRSDKRLVLQAMCQVAHELGMSVLLSEVSAKKDLKLLEDLECELLQGERLGSILPAGEFEDLFI